MWISWLKLMLITVCLNAKKTLWALEEGAADGGEGIEEADAEGDDGGGGGIDAEAIAEEGEPGGEEGVGDEAGEEDAVAVGLMELGPDGAEDAIERGQDSYSRVAGVLLGDGEVKLEADQEAHEQEEHGDPEAKGGGARCG